MLNSIWVQRLSSKKSLKFRFRLLVMGFASYLNHMQNRKIKIKSEAGIVPRG